jgi:phosphoglycerol transferase
MQSVFSSRLKTVLALAGALAVITIEWAATYRLFGEQKLSEPFFYWGDALVTASFVSAAAHLEFVPFLSKTLPSLGAPFVAQWNDFPVSEDLAYFVPGLLARFVGLFRAINLAFLVACWLAAASMFSVSRRLRFSRVGAMMASVGFGFPMFIVARGVHHFGLIFYFGVPWAILLSMWLASRKGVSWQSPHKFRGALAIGLLLSFSNVYFFTFALQLWLGSSAIGLVRWPSSQRALSAVGIALVCALGFLSMNADSLVARMKFGPNVTVAARAPTDVERFALKPINFFVAAGNHRYPSLRGVAFQSVKANLTHGEQPAPYLGVWGGVLFLCLLFGGLTRKKWPFVSGWSAGILALIVLNSVGGFNSVLGLLDVYLLRSTNRASIFVLGFVMLFCAQKGPALFKWLPHSIRGIAALAFASMAAWEAIPLPQTLQEASPGRAMAAADEKLVQSVERKLPVGSTVFCLPAVDFPEASGPGGVDGSEMFRPYFYSRHLIFSHGDLKGREHAQWKFRVSQLPAPEMIQELKANGFSALYVNVRGYTDVSSLEAAGARVLERSSIGDSLFLTIE